VSATAAQAQAQAQAQTEAEAQTEDDPAPIGDPLKIGFLADFSGPLAEFGPVIQTGVELALKHVNDAGGVLGQPVQLVTGDTQVDSVLGVEEAPRLVEVEGVDAIVGPLSSTVTIAVAESVTGPAVVLTISPSATSAAVTAADDKGYLFPAPSQTPHRASCLPPSPLQRASTTSGVVFRNDAYGQVPIAIAFPTEAQIFIREALENDIFSQFLFVDGTKSQDLIEPLRASRPRRGTRSPPASTGSPRTAPSATSTSRPRSAR